jgi:hypothetical protein
MRRIGWTFEKDVQVSRLGEKVASKCRKLGAQKFYAEPRFKVPELPLLRKYIHKNRLSKIHKSRTSSRTSFSDSSNFRMLEEVQYFMERASSGSNLLVMAHPQIVFLPLCRLLPLACSSFGKKTLFASRRSSVTRFFFSFSHSPQSKVCVTSNPAVFLSSC